MLLESWMEGRYVGAELGSNYPMVRKEAETEDLPLHGTDGPGMTIVEEVHHQDADHQGGEAFLVAVAGLFLEIGGEKDHCPGKEIISHLALFLDQEAVLGPMSESEAATFSSVQKNTIEKGFLFLKCPTLFKIFFYLLCTVTCNK